MADNFRPQPIRTDLDGDVVSKICDSTTPANQLKVNADGSVDMNLLTTDVDIRDLAFATDKVDVGGSVVELGATTLAALETITVVATDLDIRDLSRSTDSIKADLALDGVLVGNSNPVPVHIVQETLGDVVVDYHTSANLAAAASINFDYTISASAEFHLEKVIAVSGGKLKAQIQTSVDGIAFLTKAVLFATPSSPMIDYHLGKDMFVPVSGVGSKVRVIITNMDNQAADVYCTIHGLEL